MNVFRIEEGSYQNSNNLEKCKVIGGYDFYNNNLDPMDDHGHGTHVAAIAAGNGILKGVAPDAKLYAYKVLGEDGGGTSKEILAAIERAVDPNQDGDFSDHVDVISMSLGITCKFLGGYYPSCGPDDPISTAVDNAFDADVIVVVAAGNEGRFGKSTISSPGTARNAITIGASTSEITKDYIARFSSRGPIELQNELIIKPDITAPGVGICAAQWEDAFENTGAENCIDNKHVAISGTSMATPHVAGAVALLKQKYPDWTSEEIKMALRNTAIKTNFGTFDMNEQGYGKINILNIFKLIDAPPIAKIDTSGLITSDKIDIMGTADARNFFSYQLYYAKASEPNKWIEITKKFNSIHEGIIYSDFETDKLDEGLNYLKLVVVNIFEEESEDISLINIFCRDCKKGWPIKFPGQLYSSPSIGDINKDGKLEIIVGSTDGTIYALNYDGTLVKDWPIKLQKHPDYPEFPFRYTSSPALGDINNDGYLEIALRTNDGMQHLLNYRGSYLEGWPKSFGGFYLSLLVPTKSSSPVLYDMNNDNYLDFIFAQSSVYITNNKGESLPNWPEYFQSPFGFNDGVYASPSVGDINNDGKNNLVFGTYQGFLYASDASGNILDGWPVDLGLGSEMRIDKIKHNPTLGDINKDNNLEILIGYGNKLYVYNYKGDLLWKKEFPTNSRIEDNTPVLADITGDGKLEVAIYLTETKLIYALNSEGNVLPGWPQVVKKEKPFTSSLIIFDIDNDNKKEIFLGEGQKDIYFSKDLFVPLEYYTYLEAWHYDGTIVEGWPKKISNPALTLAVGDLDNNGKTDIVVADSNGYIYVWELDNVHREENLEWPMFRHNAQNTGTYTSPQKTEQQCDNNIREGTEQCDGTDDINCPGLCLLDCACATQDQLFYLTKEYGNKGETSQLTEDLLSLHINKKIKIKGFDVSTFDKKIVVRPYFYKLIESKELLTKELLTEETELQCEDCGTGLFNLCDKQECWSMGDCVYNNGECQDVPEGFEKNIQQEIENIFDEDPILDSIPEANICLMTFVNDKTTYSYLINKNTEDTGVMTKSVDKYTCEIRSEPDISVYSFNAFDLLNSMESSLDSSCDAFTAGLNEPTFYLYESQLINPNEDTCNSEFEYKYCPTVNKCMTDDEIFNSELNLNCCLSETDLCSMCGEGIFNLCDEEECNELGCVFEDEECVPGGEEEPICIDTDEGLDYFTKGRTEGYLSTGQSYKATDTCTNESSLAEHYCKDNNFAFMKLYNCPLPHVCHDGACVTECTDTDGGVDKFVKGNTIGFKGTIYHNKLDVCVKDSEGAFSKDPKFQNQVYEFSCKDGLFNSGLHNCENGCYQGACETENITCHSVNDCPEPVMEQVCEGSKACNNTPTYSCINPGTTDSYCNIIGYGKSCDTCLSGCENGICVGGEIEGCIDTDGGKNHFTKGTTYGATDKCCKDGSLGYVADCKTENTLMEYLCFNNKRSVEFYECKNGCDEGKCNSKTISLKSEEEVNIAHMTRIKFIDANNESPTEFFNKINNKINIVRGFEEDGIKVYDPSIPVRFNTIKTIRKDIEYEFLMNKSAVFSYDKATLKTIEFQTKCKKEFYPRYWGRKKCDSTGSLCHSKDPNSEYSRCKTSNFMGMRWYREICKTEYTTDCSANPECDSGFKEVLGHKRKECTS